MAVGEGRWQAVSSTWIDPVINRISAGSFIHTNASEIGENPTYHLLIYLFTNLPGQ
jgi:hypothetical protein